MLIEEGLKTYLGDSVPLTALVGDRIHPAYIPQGGNVPAITFQDISTTHEHDLDGSAGLRRTRLQINCWAASYLQTKTLAEAVRRRLDGFTGLWGSVAIQTCRFDSGSDLFEPASGADSQRRFGYQMDFFVWANETFPDFT